MTYQDIYNQAPCFIQNIKAGTFFIAYKTTHEDSMFYGTTDALKINRLSSVWDYSTEKYLQGDASYLAVISLQDVPTDVLRIAALQADWIALELESRKDKTELLADIEKNNAILIQEQILVAKYLNDDTNYKKLISDLQSQIKEYQNHQYQVERVRSGNYQPYIDKLNKEITDKQKRLQNLT